MQIADAQREVRTHFVGGFYGQLVSGLLWLGAASLATWSTPRAAIMLLVFGGFFIFPATVLLIRLSGNRGTLNAGNGLRYLGMQTAFVLPMSMPLLVPVTRYNQNLFFPATMILVGAHYLPFVFLYGMRMFAVLAALLVGGGIGLAIYWSNSFAAGAWCAGVALVVFGGLGRAIARRERLQSAQ
jgi:hypothetical protein